MPRLSVGKHIVEVLRAGFCEAQSGTAGITLQFGNEEGEIDHVLWITPKTRERVIENLETLGIPGKALDEYDTLERLDEMLRGNQCSITCEEEEYRGDTQVKVKWINPVNSGSPELKSRIYGLLSGKVAPARSGPTPKPPPLPPPSSMPPNNSYLTDDDVPF